MADLTSTQDSNDIYFITGATGLMGSEFVYEVLKNSNTHCILLIRAENEAKAQKRLERLLSYLYPDKYLRKKMSTRVDFVIGEVSCDQLGMSNNDWQNVSNTTNYILHAAALTDWGASYDYAYSVNVNGVKQVLNLAKSCTKLRKMIHISTAYVTGSRTGNLTPDEFCKEDEICDNYQKTKTEGEHLVREQWDTLPISIVRPGAVVGNSDTGRTLTYKTFYYPLQILYNGLPLILPVNKKGLLEAVPSDWSAKVMQAMMLESDTNGKCYHLTSGKKAFTNAKLKKITYKTFHKLGEKPKKSVFMPYFLYTNLFSNIIKKKIINGRDLDNNIRLYRHYMTYIRNFDNTTTLQFSQQKNIELPEFDTYFETLIQYAIANKWQRKRSIMSKLKARSK